jgi:Leucine-rich repeat (LRR) protein
MSDLDVIKEIEKIIGEKLKPCPPDKDIMDSEQRGCYLLNNSQIIGLNLSKFRLWNIDFLKDFKNLTQVNFNDNFISDINPLRELKKINKINLSNNKIKDITNLKSLKNVTELNLERNFIYDINPLKELKKINKINLSSNKITDISILNELKNLTEIDLGNNQLIDFIGLKDLSNLIILDLAWNKLSDFSGLKNLSSLTKLDLGYNQLSDISSLKELSNLTSLDLRDNHLSDISGLKELPNLTSLDLENNQLRDISSLKYLSNLTSLGLKNNQLRDISSLKDLSNLTFLDLGNNQLSDFSGLKDLSNLTILVLENNQLTSIPEWMLNLNIPIILNWDNWDSRDNKGIILEDNPIEQPPIEIIKQGNEAIRAYFEQLKKEGTDTIYEAKLILVGEGGAGKTSLANKIKNPDWQLVPENESISTQGIDILKYEFPYKDKTFHVNIWDFGGQEIYHQTHQFFLSKRSLYSIVIDSRADSPNLDYWFKLVELLSNNSPLLIIKNEKQNRLCTSIQESELRAEFNNIKDSFPTNLSDNRGLPEIVKALQYYITDLPHIGSPLPKTWVKVREQLEQDSRYHIELKEYFTICQANGFEKEADKLQLSEYLHDLGVCLHFQNHPLLRKTLILKPTWATDAVYKVLDNDTVKNQAGHFNDNDLADIWQDEQYNTMRGELLALMQKFKLCYEIRNQPQHYIAPQLLKDKAPQYNWQTNDLLLLRYKYDFMPKGILSQFIVEMHEYIANNYQWVWKSGVILEKDKTQAEIIEYYGKREIHIRVQGNNKKELLNIVSYELDKINGSYERLKDKCKKLIPCNCEKCHDTQEPHFYDYAELKERVSHRRYDIECRKPPYNKIDILKLIDDIDLPDINIETEKNNPQFHFKDCSFNNSEIINAEENAVIEGRKNIKVTGKYIDGDVTGGYIAGGEIKIINKEEHNINAEENSQVQQFNQSSNNTVNQTQNKPSESKEESLFKKPLFYLGVAGFIYFMAVAWAAYDLQQQGLLGNKSFKEIVLAPIPLLKTDDKK